MNVRESTSRIGTVLGVALGAAIVHQKAVWKFIRSLCLSLAISFYMAFALQMLWDWFVVAAFHVEEIGYWNMCGLVLIVKILSSGNLDVAPVLQQWQRAITMLEACIPEEKRTETMRVVDEETLSDTWLMAVGVYMKASTTTIFLLIGWAIHTVFM